MRRNNVLALDAEIFKGYQGTCFGAISQYVGRNADLLLNELKEAEETLDIYHERLAYIHSDPKYFCGYIMECSPKCESLAKLGSAVQELLGKTTLENFIGALGSFEYGKFFVEQVMQEQIGEGQEIKLKGANDVMDYIAAAKQHITYLMHEIGRIRDAESLGKKKLIVMAMLI